jgi:hypothetical protein
MQTLADMTITTDRMSPRMIVEGIGTHDEVKE